jgi:hypothetical protein
MKLPFDLYVYHDDGNNKGLTLCGDYPYKVRINATEVEWIPIYDEGDYRYMMRNKPEIFKYNENGDTFDEVSYYEAEYSTVIQSDDETGNPIYNIVERFYNPLDCNAGILISFPYYLFVIKQYEELF